MSNLLRPFKHPRMPEIDDLYVVTTIFNPMRYRSRYELYWEFEAHMQDLGAQLMTVELAFGDRPFEVTRSDNPLHVQLRTDQELWLKESALNAGIARLPSNWKYVMWSDADIHFHRPDLLEEVVHQLQHYDIVQCFEDAVDLGPRGEVLEVHKGFAWSWRNLDTALDLVGGSWRELENSSSYYYASPSSALKSRTSILHPGFCWSARRSAIQALGGLFDVGILGAGDHHLAHALAGRILKSVPPNLSLGYIRALSEYQTRADVHIRGNFGTVPGMLTHNFHGHKKDRKYRERWEVIHKHMFDPDLDLKRDWNGLWALTDVGIRMQHDLRQYMLQRNEDAV